MQLDVFRNTGASATSIPSLLDVQADLLDHLDTRIVIPLVHTLPFGRQAKRLHIPLPIENIPVVVATHLLAAVSTATLSAALTNLAHRRDEIIPAIDILWSGV